MMFHDPLQETCILQQYRSKAMVTAWAVPGRASAVN
jgi:hypothetical protein